MSDQVSETTEDGTTRTQVRDAVDASENATGNEPDEGGAEVSLPAPVHIPSQFATVRRGYDPDEVDRVIAELHARMTELERTVGEQQERLVSALRRPMLHELDDADLLVLASEETTQLVRAAKARAARVEEAAAAEASAVRRASQTEREETLASAKQTLEDARQRAEHLDEESRRRAEEAVNTAERRAAVIVSDAEERSSTMLADAERRAATMVGDAEQQAATVVSDAEQQAATIVQAAEQRYEEIREAIKRHREQLREELDDQRTELHQVVESMKVLRQEFSTSFKQVTETMDQVRNLSGMLWRFGEPVQRAEGYVEQVFEQLGEASLPPREHLAGDDPTGPADEPHDSSAGGDSDDARGSGSKTDRN